MTGRERILRVLAGEPADRPPVMASFIAAGAEWRGIPQSRVHLDAEALVDAELVQAAELGLDGAYVSSDNWIAHAALGGEVEFPVDDEPRARRVVVDEWDRLPDLGVPDPESAPRMAFMLDAARRAVARNEADLFLEANIDSGPFQMAGILRGAQRWMLDVATEPARAHELLAFCTRVACAYADAMARTGVDAVQFGDSTASLINAAMYEEFVEPYQRAVIAATRDAGAHAFLHVCGRSNHLSARLAASGAACVEVDGPADLAATVAAFGGAPAVRGNVPTTLLRDGSADAVAACARECLRTAAGAPFILSPGCGVPRGTPLGNVRALVDAAQALADE